MYIPYQHFTLYVLQPFVDIPMEEGGNVLPQTYVNVNLVTLVLTAKLVGIALISLHN